MWKLQGTIGVQQRVSIASRKHPKHLHQTKAISFRLYYLLTQKARKEVLILSSLLSFPISFFSSVPESEGDAAGAVVRAGVAADMGALSFTSKSSPQSASSSSYTHKTQTISTLRASTPSNERCYWYLLGWCCWYGSRSRRSHSRTHT